ncbi:hypothetical protein [Frigoribacterium sp. VKM Ac-2836]|uniref:hypothetical protein n=1 Tax=Frigoribacterium sp. VKM Ac-2836 TaxID=2739014 RepID=UPI00156418BF|nr:hypothetical protein [Frigoribacterium sp. VKM Ac-2836]NRD25837.1 hypothetical protein [Frigoribacterium sp. VKM Ac-2836]
MTEPELDERLTTAENSNTRSIDGFFEDRDNPRPKAQKLLFATQHGPAEYRDSGLQPLHVSSLEGSRQLRHEYELGMDFLGYQERNPQGYMMADAINALDDEGLPRSVITAICVGRRAGKTTTVFAIILGRMLSRPNYMVGFTAQTQVKARERFMRDVYDRVTRRWDITDESCPVKMGVAMGQTYLVVKATGSRLTIMPPTSDAARGDAYSLFVIDEAQQFTEDHGQALLGGILPTFSTLKGQAQLIMMGTPAEAQSGLLWSQLEKGRAGTGGIVEYGANPFTPDHEEGESIEGTTSDPDVWVESHPGIGNLTTLRDVRVYGFEGMSLADFKREFLCLWPAGSASRFINPTDWDACKVGGDLPELPAHWALGFAIHPEGKFSSIVAAWRDDKGLAHLSVLDSRDGVRWVGTSLSAIYKKHRKTIVYDSASSGANVEIEGLNRTLRPRVSPQSWPNVSTAASLVTKLIRTHALRHHDHPALNEAVASATKRGTRDSNRWAFGRIDYGSDITALEAGAMALRFLDETPERQPLPRIA